MSKMRDPNEIDVDSVIQMAWKDSVSFGQIEEAWGLSEARVIEIMRRELDESTFRRWRRRLGQRTERVASRRRKAPRK